MRAAAANGVSALHDRELRELALLYRQTAADLSTARADPRAASLARYLNELLGRAHNHVYTGAPGGARGILYFYMRRFPQIFRETWRYTAAATLVFFAGVALGVVLSTSDPGFDRYLLGPQMVDTIDQQEMWTHSIVSVKPLASSGIMTNNLSVSFMTFATGIIGGLGTLYMLTVNGLLMGVISTACTRAGMALSLFSFVAPHGALELPAIFIAGGAGFILARGVLVPGLLSRRDALAQAGGQAIRLLLGIIPMLVIAGLIEGFISPTYIDASFKFAIGAGLFVLLVLYLLMPGRSEAALTQARLDGFDEGVTEDSAP